MGKGVRKCEVEPWSTWAGRGVCGRARVLPLRCGVQNSGAMALAAGGAGGCVVVARSKNKGTVARCNCVDPPFVCPVRATVFVRARLRARVCESCLCACVVHNRICEPPLVRLVFSEFGVKDPSPAGCLRLHRWSRARLCARQNAATSRERRIGESAIAIRQFAGLVVVH